MEGVMNLAQLLDELEQSRLKATQGEWLEDIDIDRWKDDGRISHAEAFLKKSLKDVNSEIAAFTYDGFAFENFQENLKFVQLSANHILQLIKACRVLRESLNKTLMLRGHIAGNAFEYTRPLVQPLIDAIIEAEILGDDCPECGNAPNVKAALEQYKQSMGE